MRKRIVWVTLSIFIASALIYLISDSKLYYYGESNFNILKYDLPLNLEPNYWDSDYGWPVVGFIIEYNKVLFIGKGVEYNYSNDTVVVKKITKYGYNQNALIAQIEDVKGVNYYIECVRSKSEKIRESILDETATIDTGNYTWIEIDGDKVTKLRKVNGFSILLFIILIPLFILSSFILKKTKEVNDENM